MQLAFPYLLAGLTVFLAVATLWRLAVMRARSRIQWLLVVFGNALFFGFVFLAGPWAYISFYLSWIYLAAYLVSLAFAFRRFRKLPWSGPPPSIFFWIGRVVSIGLFGLLFVQYLLGSSHSDDGVNIAFPLHQGQYYVMQGGGSQLTNFFHRGSGILRRSKAYRYAMDIAKLDRWGKRANGIFPSKLSDYAIWGDTIYSPVNGRVLVAVKDLVDNAPGVFDTKHLGGNHVVIQAEGVRISLMHMQHNRVFVHAGEVVRVGQPIGLVGNTGFSSEPHLHIGANRDYSDNSIYGGRSVPIFFGGTFYKLNELVRNGNK